MRPFAEGEVIGVYMGKAIPEAEQVAYKRKAQEEAAKPDGDKQADEYIMAAGSTWVDGNVKGNVMRRANDGRGTQWPNNAKQRAGGEYGVHNTGDDRWGITIEATRPIKMGEEILLDYGDDYWRYRAAAKVKAGGRKGRASEQTTQADDGGDGGTSGTSTSATTAPELGAGRRRRTTESTGARWQAGRVTQYNITTAQPRSSTGSTSERRQRASDGRDGVEGRDEGVT